MKKFSAIFYTKVTILGDIVEESVIAVDCQSTDSLEDVRRKAIDWKKDWDETDRTIHFLGIFHKKRDDIENMLKVLKEMIK